MQSAVLTWNLEEIWKQQNASVSIGKQRKYDTISLHLASS